MVATRRYLLAFTSILAGGLLGAAVTSDRTRQRESHNRDTMAVESVAHDDKSQEGVSGVAAQSAQQTQKLPPGMVLGPDGKP
jgi:hypothetical protein